MAYNEELAHRIRNSIGQVPGLTEKQMFGGLAFLINGHMAVSAGHSGGLLLRCDPAQTESLIEDPHADRFVMRGRELNGWLYIHGKGVATPADLDRWVAVGLSYAGALPAK